MSDISKIRVNGNDYNIKSLPTIKEYDSTGTGFNLEDNTVFRFTKEVSSLALALPNTINQLFQCELAFKSGTTATSLSYDESIKWSGDDIKDNVFVPVANKTYNILFWYDGFNMNAVVRGV